MSGDLQHSSLLTTKLFSPSQADQLTWIPGSSSITFVDSDGLLHLSISSGQLLWSVTSSDRRVGLHEAQTLEPDMIRKLTWLSASPCGRWIVASDCYGPIWSQDKSSNSHSLHIAIVEVATSRIVHRHQTRGRERCVHCSWSDSGTACLLHETAIVLGFRGSRRATPAFVQYRLIFDPSDNPGPGVRLTSLSLSPCGSIVLGNQQENSWFGSSRLQRWQLPPASAAPEANAQAVVDMRPSFCDELRSMKLHNRLEIAWHPLQNACVVALADQQDGVHLINTSKNVCMRSWSEDELHGSAAQAGVTDEAHRSCKVQMDRRSLGDIPHVLRWSKDGRKLAILSRDKCAILCF